MKVSVVGAGYVGLVTATCFAEFGFEVFCIDKEDVKVKALSQGQIPIYEPGLDTLVIKNHQSGRLKFSTDLPSCVAQSDVVFIAVGTPTRSQGGEADLSFVYEATREIALSLNGFTVIVTKSTVPVGTAQTLRAQIKRHNPQADFAIASNPEFLREGSAIDDFLQPDRVVIGVEDERAQLKLLRLYRPLILQEVPVVVTSCETAELIKYAANAFLASRIGFINEIADLCEVLGANVSDVARGIGLDHRIGQHYLHPGPGFGGSCFPKDTRALASTARSYGAPLRIVEAVVEANDLRKKGLATRIERLLGESLEGKKLGILGVSFKADTDDMRDSASLDLIPALEAAGANVFAYDPAAMAVAQPFFLKVQWCLDPYAVAEGADAIIVLTEWNMFRGLDLTRIANSMKKPILIDFRNLYSALEIAQTPLHYYSLGRPALHPTPEEKERLLKSV